MKMYQDIIIFIDKDTQRIVFSDSTGIFNTPSITMKRIVETVTSYAEVFAKFDIINEDERTRTVDFTLSSMTKTWNLRATVISVTVPEIDDSLPTPKNIIKPQVDSNFMDVIQEITVWLKEQGKHRMPPYEYPTNNTTLHRTYSIYTTTKIAEYFRNFGWKVTIKWCKNLDSISDTLIFEWNGE